MKTHKTYQFIGVIMIAALTLGFAAGCSAPTNDDTFAISGGVDAVSPRSITIDGKTFKLKDDLALPGALRVGDEVSVDVTVGPDGTETVVDVDVAAATSQ